MIKSNIKKYIAVNVMEYVFLCFIAEDDGPTLPTKANEEFRPFIRRLPEFKFW